MPCCTAAALHEWNDQRIVSISVELFHLHVMVLLPMLRPHRLWPNSICQTSCLFYADPARHHPLPEEQGQAWARGEILVTAR